MGTEMHGVLHGVLHRQGVHLLAWLLAGALLWMSMRVFPPGQARVWGLDTEGWMVLSWLAAGCHQGWIVLNWRLEFFHGRISAWLGRAAFPVFRAGFILFALGRFIPLFPVSMATDFSLPLPRAVALGLIVVTTPPILWTLYCVLVYFGFNRLVGADHFDPAYRGAALETRGIFGYIPNSMYTVLFLAAYHPGLLWHSRPALFLAAMHHALVWCHYFCTEKPDMRAIYGGRGA